MANTSPRPPRDPEAGCRIAPPEPAPLPALALNRHGLFKLLTWLSPAFPVGSFAYSSGLEWAIAVGDVVDSDGVRQWVRASVSDGNGFCDTVFLAHAHRATAAGDVRALAAVTELAGAFAASKERFLESSAQGAAFVAAIQGAWPCMAIDQLLELSPPPWAYPVAVAVAAAGHEIALEPTAVAYLQGAAANLVSAAVRLVPLGQTAAQRLLADLDVTVQSSVLRALATELDEVGTATVRVDLASQQHEWLTTRLFRS